MFVYPCIVFPVNLLKKRHIGKERENVIVRELLYVCLFAVCIWSVRVYTYVFVCFCVKERENV